MVDMRNEFFKVRHIHTHTRARTHTRGHRQTERGLTVYMPQSTSKIDKRMTTCCWTSKMNHTSMRTVEERNGRDPRPCLWSKSRNENSLSNKVFLFKRTQATAEGGPWLWLILYVTLLWFSLWTVSMTTGMINARRETGSCGCLDHDSRNSLIKQKKYIIFITQKKKRIQGKGSRF